jgi:hypothetical protein
MYFYIYWFRGDEILKGTLILWQIKDFFCVIGNISHVYLVVLEGNGTFLKIQIISEYDKF